MQELQVETFGSMDRREKVDFILEQMRLLKEQEDWEKMAIVAKRINLKWLGEKEHEVRWRFILFFSRFLPSPRFERGVSDVSGVFLATTQDLKLRYYSLMILYGLSADKYLDVAKHYRSVYATSTISENPSASSAVLRNIVYFLVLAPYDNEQSDLLNRVYGDDKLKEMKES
jgi:26S proteasome regulatory subunit N5